MDMRSLALWISNIVTSDIRIWCLTNLLKYLKHDSTTIFPTLPHGPFLSAYKYKRNTAKD